MVIGETCPRCGHVFHPTRAVGVFNPTGPDGYRAVGVENAPLRPTRAEAQADVCRGREVRT